MIDSINIESLHPENEEVLKVEVCKDIIRLIAKVPSYGRVVFNPSMEELLKIKEFIESSQEYRLKFYENEYKKLLLEKQEREDMAKQVEVRNDSQV